MEQERTYRFDGIAWDPPPDLPSRDPAPVRLPSLRRADAGVARWPTLPRCPPWCVSAVIGGAREGLRLHTATAVTTARGARIGRLRIRGHVPAQRRNNGELQDERIC